MASSAGPVSPEVYWRRRVVVLAAVLIVVAFIAWSCSGPSEDGRDSAADSPDDTESSNEDTPSTTVPRSPEPSEESSAGPEEHEEDPLHSSGSVGGDGSAGGDSRDGAGDTEAASGGGGTAGESGEVCTPEDIVVTLKTDQSDYAAGEEPVFELSIVNIGEGTCALDVGPENMELRVTSGDDRIFSTADCVSDSADHERLQRGVPHTVAVTWERKRSWKDCRDRESDARPGTYVVSLHSEYDAQTEDQVFRLH